MKQLDKYFSLIAILFLVTTANAYALNVLAEPDFKMCAEQYKETKRLSEECNILWRTIEQKMTDDIEKETAEFNCGRFTGALAIGRCEKRAEEYKQCRSKSVVPCNLIRDINDFALQRQRNLVELKKKPAALKKMKSQSLLQGKKVMLANLKDADSAKFRNLTVSPDATILCGEVNAKNSMGGYTGFKRFVVTGSSIVEIEGEGKYPATFNKTWEEDCH